MGRFKNFCPSWQERRNFLVRRRALRFNHETMNILRSILAAGTLGALASLFVIIDLAAQIPPPSFHDATHASVLRLPLSE
jgi:hypothetical protein